MEKIICENYSGDSYNAEDFFTGNRFPVKPGLKFTCFGYDIEPFYAVEKGFYLADTFKLPAPVNTKQKLTQYLQDIGLKRGSEGYQAAYNRFSGFLPHETMVRGSEQPSKAHIGFFDLKHEDE